MDQDTDFRTQYKTAQKQALDLLLDWSNGSIAQLAACAGVTTAGGMRWVENGRISTRGAMALEKFPGCPLTKEAMRPDVKIWPTEGEAQST